MVEMAVNVAGYLIRGEAQMAYIMEKPEHISSELIMVQSSHIVKGHKIVQQTKLSGWKCPKKIIPLNVGLTGFTF